MADKLSIDQAIAIVQWLTESMARITTPPGGGNVVSIYDKKDRVDTKQ